MVLAVFDDAVCRVFTGNAAAGNRADRGNSVKIAFIGTYGDCSGIRTDNAAEKVFHRRFGNAEDRIVFTLGYACAAFQLADDAACIAAEPAGLSLVDRCSGKRAAGNFRGSLGRLRQCRPENSCI